jgi:CDGSH-type Zn-finger protein
MERERRTQPEDGPGSREERRVKVTKDGPYVVTGDVSLRDERIRVDDEDQCHGWDEGERYPAGATYRLCRCGESRHKPFCDNTHAEVGFDGTETAAAAPYDEQAEEIDGPDLKLSDAKELCATARFCHRNRGTWELVREPRDPADRETAIEESWDCPSGRLVAREKDGRAIEPELEPSVGLVEDTQAGKMGPIWVKGGIPVEAADGRTYEIRNRVTLCRCGRSANKPLCDGSHLE